MQGLNNIKASNSKPKDDSLPVWEVLLFCFLMIATVVSGTVLIYYYTKRYQCFTEPSPYCRKDWCCVDVATSNPGDPRVFPYCNTKTFVEKCTIGEDGKLPPDCTDLLKLNCNSCDGCDYDGPLLP